VLRALSTAVPVTCRRGWPVAAARPGQEGKEKRKRKGKGKGKEKEGKGKGE